MPCCAWHYFGIYCKGLVHNARQGVIVMFESSITTKGQTTLPKAVRDSLAVKAGDKVRYVIVDEVGADHAGTAYQPSFPQPEV